MTPEVYRSPGALAVRAFPVDNDAESLVRSKPMPTIHLMTVIEAPIERVFDLARSIEAHTASTFSTGERAVAGRTSGLIGPGETVTWEAKHLGVRQRLTVRVTQFDRPRVFSDEMTQGAFRSLRHTHRFREEDGRTVMEDELQFRAPLGPLGWLAEQLFLTRYMRRFLEIRNRHLKAMAEGEEWVRFLPEV